MSADEAKQKYIEQGNKLKEKHGVSSQKFFLFDDYCQENTVLLYFLFFYKCSSHNDYKSLVCILQIIVIFIFEVCFCDHLKWTIWNFFRGIFVIVFISFIREAFKKQAENGLQSRSSENGSVTLWIEIAYHDLPWMTFMDDCQG